MYFSVKDFIISMKKRKKHFSYYKNYRLLIKSNAWIDIDAHTRHINKLLNQYFFINFLQIKKILENVRSVCILSFKPYIAPWTLIKTITIPI